MQCTLIICHCILLRMRNVSDQNYKGNKKKLLSIFFSPTKLQFIRYAEKHGGIRQVIDYKIIGHRKYTICVSGNKGKNTDTLSNYLILIAAPWQQCLANAPRCYFISISPVLLFTVLWQDSLKRQIFLENRFRSL